MITEEVKGRVFDENSNAHQVYKTLSKHMNKLFNHKWNELWNESFSSWKLIHLPSISLSFFFCFLGFFLCNFMSHSLSFPFCPFWTFLSFLSVLYILWMILFSVFLNVSICFSEVHVFFVFIFISLFSHFPLLLFCLFIRFSSTCLPFFIKPFFIFLFL